MSEEMNKDAVAADRALLVLAAKAGRIEIESCTCSDPKWPYRLAGKSGVRAHWNPLINDGDALRLATTLQLSILWFTNLQYVIVERRGFGENIGWVDDAGRNGAVRRAITVVAARIGSTLP